MDAPTTLADFADADSQTPASRLRAIVEEPNMHDFGENLWHHGAPVGLDDAREVDDSRLLQRYRDLVADYCNPFSDNPHMRRIADDVANYLHELDDRIAAAEYPPEREWPVSKAFIDRVAEMDYPTNDAPAFDRYGWYEVNHLSTSDLEFVRETLDVVYNPGVTTKRDDILAGLLYYRNDANVDIRDIFTVENRGKGANPSYVYHNLEHVMDALHPVMGALAACALRKITTNKGRKTNAGWYTNGDKTINIRTDTRLKPDDDRTGWDCTTAHEMGHVLHYLYGYRLSDSSVDNRGTDPEDWAWNVQGYDDPNATTTQQDAFWVTIALEWEKMRDGDIGPLEEYQTKNALEFFCVAFEAWVADPEHLATEQPRMKRLLDAHFGPDSRAGS